MLSEVVAAVRLVLEVGEWVLGGTFDAVLDGSLDIEASSILRGIVGCIFSLGI